MAAVRKPASTEIAVQSFEKMGWTQSFARTRGRSRRTRQVLSPKGDQVKRLGAGGSFQRGAQREVWISSRCLR